MATKITTDDAQTETVNLARMARAFRVLGTLMLAGSLLQVAGVLYFTEGFSVILALTAVMAIGSALFVAFPHRIAYAAFADMIDND